MPEKIDPAKKAAIVAAIAAFMGTSPRPGMFLRDCKDSGAWGKLSRLPAPAYTGYRRPKGQG